MVFWLLAREVLILRGQHPVNQEWNVMVDLFIARDIETIRSQQEEAKKEEDEEKRAKDDVKDNNQPIAVEGDENW